MACLPRSELAPSTPDNAAMGDVLARTASELRLIAGLAQTLQVTISPLLARASPDTAAAQNLDMLTQLVEGLAAFITGLGEGCPPDWTASTQAAAALGLHDQKLRLCSPSTPQNEYVDAGALELF